MKKYFLKGTEKEVSVGDVIQSDTTKDLDNGHTKYCHLDTLVCDETIPVLLESGIIEEREEEDPGNYEGLDFCLSTTDLLLEDMLKTQEALDEKLDLLLAAIKHIANSMPLKKDAGKKSGK